EVAERPDQGLVLRLSDDEERELLRPLADELGRGLRRGLLEPSGIDDADAARLRVRGERAAHGGASDLAVDLRDEVPTAGRKRQAAAGPVRRADRAGASTAGALLAPRLRASARDEPSALAATGGRAGRVLLRAHGLVHELRLHVRAEDLRLKRDGLGRANHLCLQGTACGAAIRTCGLRPCVRLN